MENKTYSNIPNLSSTSNHSSNNNTLTTTTTPNSFVLSSSINTPTTPSLQTLQAVPTTQPIEVYSDNNNNNRSNIVITQPTFNKLLSETIKQEQFENPAEYSTGKNQIKADLLKTDNTQQKTGLTSVHRNPRETINNLSAISMANITGHILPTLNSSHLPNGATTYFVSGLPSDIPSNYKIPTTTNSDLPSPSTSSNSSNPSSSNHHHHHPHHQAKRHGETHDPTRKREVRLQKNREAARECRRKKKEYIKCLEERVTTLENQNKALIEELRQLKELYCQREDTNNNTNSKTTTSTTR